MKLKITLVFLIILTAGFVVYKATKEPSCNRILMKNIRGCVPAQCQIINDTFRIVGMRGSDCLYEEDTTTTQTRCSLPKERLASFNEAFQQRAWLEELGPVKESRVVYQTDSETKQKIKLGQVRIGGLWVEPAQAFQKAVQDGFCKVTKK